VPIHWIQTIRFSKSTAATKRQSLRFTLNTMRSAVTMPAVAQDCLTAAVVLHGACFTSSNQASSAAVTAG
jgi:hypothetical protein